MIVLAEVCKLLLLLYFSVIINCYFLDVDECNEGNALCTQNCHNSIGSYVCTCLDGYIISLDGIHCIGKHIIQAIVIDGILVRHWLGGFYVI